MKTKLNVGMNYKKNSGITEVCYIKDRERFLRTLDLHGINKNVHFSNTENDFQILWFYVTRISNYEFTEEIVDPKEIVVMTVDDIYFVTEVTTKEMIKILEEKLKSNDIDSDINDFEKWRENFGSKHDKFTKKNVENFLKFLRRTPDGFTIRSRYMTLPEYIDYFK